MANSLASLLKSILPGRLARLIKQHYEEEKRRERAEREREIPRVHLETKHVAHCQAVLNRAVMLAQFDEGGVVAEVGVNKGTFSQQILDVVAPKRLHLIDLWGSDRYHGGLHDRVQDKFSSERDEGRVQVHRKHSVKAAAEFDDEYFDWVYIDTNHSYETTRDELRAYAPKVKPSGVIAGHDYVTGNWVSGFRYGVMEAVHEFCVECDWELAYITVDIAENRSFAIQRIK